MPQQSLLSWGALALALGVGVLFHARTRSLEARVAELEHERLSAPDDAAADAPGAGDAPGLSGRRTAREVAELRRLTNALVQRVDENEARVRGLGEGGADAPQGAAPALRTPAFHEAVREVVLELAEGDVAFRAKIGTSERTKLPKNAPFARLAQVLQLDTAQESQMSKDLQEIQQELFGVLSAQRDDGVVPMEEIAKAESLKDGDPKKAQLFVRLLTLKIPGSEETYMQRAFELTGDFRKKATAYLRPAQVEIWQNLEVDLFSVKFD